MDDLELPASMLQPVDIYFDPPEKLPGMAGAPIKKKPPAEAASMTRSNPDGPWGGQEELLPNGLPRSPQSVLKLAREHGWGFGPITLVIRVNHPDPRIPPFFMGWLYDPATERWSYDGGRDQQGHPLAVNTVKAMLPLAGVPERDTDRGAGEQPTPPAPLLDPDCRDGKHSACIGEPCQCSCHLEEEAA